ncbi:MAG: DUF3021 domain-containing protein [Lachnospiraceae bacterium]|nr:DUF3021 domain-containing protein [Lachnospiraceae bacterium]
MKKNYIWEFVKRGLMFAWGGPFIVAIVWYCIYKSGNLVSLSVPEVVMGILSTTVLAFVAAGVSIVHQIESLPRGFAALIQGSVLLIDYGVVYLMNGWFPLNRIGIFAAIFVVGFLAIWGIIYLSVRAKVNKMNKMMK